MVGKSRDFEAAHKRASGGGDDAVSERRSRIMKSVGQKDTKPEKALRRALHSRGFRFRLHAKGYAGRPDILLPRFKAAVFDHGCFWHRHEGCRYTTTPSTRADFWHAKFEANVARDSAVRAKLLTQGWRVATIWECALRKPEQVDAATEQVAEWLLSMSESLELGEREVTSANSHANSSSSLGLST